uniref:Uncharacterized protein n=1 Tax=Opuntia streptacantha TaxID=393608 RepID=A0A7C9EW43_OPUST
MMLSKHGTAPSSAISSTALWWVESMARIASNSSTCTPLLIFLKITFTAPSLTALDLFSWTMQRLKIAEAASFIAIGCPSSKRSIKGFNAPDFPIRILFESRADNVKRAAAALLRVSSVPQLRASISNEITIGASATSFLLLSWIDMFNRVVIKSSWRSRGISSFPDPLFSIKGFNRRKMASVDSPNNARKEGIRFVSSRSSLAAALCSWIDLDILLRSMEKCSRSASSTTSSFTHPAGSGISIPRVWHH